MDRRIEKTKASIIEALSTLMKKKEYQNITVGEIIKEANVGRSTFYENYSNKDEVFDEILNNLIYHVFDEIEHKDGHLFKNNFNEEIIHLFIHIKDNEGKAKTFLLGKSANIFYEKMGEKVASICNDKLKHSDKIPEDLANAHISSTFSDVLNYWSKNKFKEAPETIAKYFIYLANEAFIIN